MEDKICFNSGSLELEGRLSKGSTRKGIVITHPHPLMGGDMNNVVVETIVRAGVEKGHTTLRFNFRGTGKSEGAFDEGKGEQQDVQAAVQFLKDNGIDMVSICGYSFGSWVSALAFDSDEAIDDMVMVSPPVNFINFKSGLTLPKLSLVITGSDDEYAAPDLVEKLLPTWNKNARLTVIGNADHFYFGFTEDLKDLLAAHL